MTPTSPRHQTNRTANHTKSTNEEQEINAIPCFLSGVWRISRFEFFQYTSTSTAACSADFITSSDFRSALIGALSFAETSGTDSRKSMPCQIFWPSSLC